MNFLNIFKKRHIPDELPALATDEIENRLESQEAKDDKEIVNSYLKQEENKEKERIEEEPKTKIEVKPEEKKEEKLPEIEESFFNEMQDNISKELTNLNKLESWYNEKFLPQDIVSDMRKYWEKQKSGSVIQVLGRNFKERIAEKTTKLQELEKEWQNTYFDLIEKEEEIREQERELKKVLAEFVEICKRRAKTKKGKK